MIQALKYFVAVASAFALLMVVAALASAVLDGETGTAQSPAMPAFAEPGDYLGDAYVVDVDGRCLHLIVGFGGRFYMKYVPGIRCERVEQEKKPR